VALIVLFAAALGTGGCAAEQTKLTLTSIDKGTQFAQQFNHAYSSRDAHGDLNVVLASESPTSVASDTRLRQIMHIRMLWNPAFGSRAGQSPPVNASIKWYVFTSGPNPQLLQYSGTGTIQASTEEGVTKLTIMSATLRPGASKGSLNDPVGTSKFEGTVIASQSEKRVTELLDEVRLQFASLTSPGALARSTGR
jgi:hypothetical protein